MKNLAVLALFICASISVGLGKDNTKNASDGDLQLYAIDDLHPLQGFVGNIEVEKKMKKVADLKDYAKKLDEFMQAHAVPIVVGPDNQFYFYDHTHETAALYRSGFKKVYGRIMLRVPNVSVKEFHKILYERGEIFPFTPEDKFMNDKGELLPYDKVPESKFEAIPKHVKDLKDNPWRTLGGELRDVVYDKTTLPFQEFRWGFASRFWWNIDAKMISNDLDGAIKAVAKASKKDPRTKFLPGARAE